MLGNRIESVGIHIEAATHGVVTVCDGVSDNSQDLPDAKCKVAAANGGVHAQVNVPAPPVVSLSETVSIATA